MNKITESGAFIICFDETKKNLFTWNSLEISVLETLTLSSFFHPKKDLKAC
jgi:hypothetical protein